MDKCRSRHHVRQFRGTHHDDGNDSRHNVSEQNSGCQFRNARLWQGWLAEYVSAVIAVDPVRLSIRVEQRGDEAPKEEEQAAKPGGLFSRQREAVIVPTCWAREIVFHLILFHADYLLPGGRTPHEAIVPPRAGRVNLFCWKC